MSDEMHKLESAKAEALAAFAAIASIIDISYKQEVLEQGSTINLLRADAVRHLSDALTAINRGNGGNV